MVLYKIISELKDSCFDTETQLHSEKIQKPPGFQRLTTRKQDEIHSTKNEIFR